MPPAQPPAARIPTATYRLQFTPAFRFEHACELIDYLHRLGVSDLYASPIWKAATGSQHGYDVTDPTALNPELGGHKAFDRLSDTLVANGMGLLADIVPNHMAASPENPWWWDVLQHGRSSPYADFFDIDWGDDPGRPSRVVLPVLGGSLQDTIDKKELTLALEARGVVVRYYSRRFPLDPRTWPRVLRFLHERLRVAIDADPSVARAWRRLGDACESVPERVPLSKPEATERRARCDAVEQHLGAFLGNHPALANAAQATLPAFTGLAGLLDEQAYRLEFWRDGLANLNYRRFFDVSDLAGLRVERPEVLAQTHALVRSLVADGHVTGLRVDHIDGLWDPGAYLRELRRLTSEDGAASPPARTRDAPAPYLLVEKILAPRERLPADWPVAGTTGYDALNVLTRVFIDPTGFERIDAHARGLLALAPTFDQTVFEGKRLVLERLFPVELTRLTRGLAALAARSGAEQVPDGDLRLALELTTASMDAYRTYVAGPDLTSADRERLTCALDEAAQRGAPAGALAFLRALLLGESSTVPPDDPDRLDFMRRWQQTTGPVMAKGLEDTALYRHVTLLSLNDVGGEPVLEEEPVGAFHAFNTQVAAERPRTLNATSTHDTKRSEDARARISVLSEIPADWTAFLDRWVRSDRLTEGLSPKPSAKDQTLLLQSLLGVWPLEWDPEQPLADRLKSYMTKAAREAKQETSWTDPSIDYESSLHALTTRLLDGSLPEFLSDFLPLASRVAFHGAFNALSQSLLRLTMPGVPDTYRGTELWDLSLVDPDNRRPVDFARRRAALDEIEHTPDPDRPALARRLCESWRDGRVKLLITRAALHARRNHPDLFATPEEPAVYEPLSPSGPHAHRLVAFIRRAVSGAEPAIVIVTPRLTSALLAVSAADSPQSLSLAEADWANTSIPLPSDLTSPGTDRLSFRDLITGRLIAPPTSPSPGLDPRELFSDVPVALLLVGGQHPVP